jgi:hypothetical protein
MSHRPLTNTSSLKITAAVGGGGGVTYFKLGVGWCSYDASTTSLSFWNLRCCMSPFCYWVCDVPFVSAAVTYVLVVSFCWCFHPCWMLLTSLLLLTFLQFDSAAAVISNVNNPCCSWHPCTVWCCHFTTFASIPAFADDPTVLAILLLLSFLLLLAFCCCGHSC